MQQCAELFQNGGLIIGYPGSSIFPLTSCCMRTSVIFTVVFLYVRNDTWAMWKTIIYIPVDICFRLVNCSNSLTSFLLSFLLGKGIPCCAGSLIAH